MNKKHVAQFVLVLIVLIGAFVAVGGSIYTSSSTFCANCHEMSTRYVSWTRSTHSEAECMDCHAGVGLGGYVKSKISGAKRLVKHFVGNIGNITIAVEDGVCMKCHFLSKDPSYRYDAQSANDPMIAPSKMHTMHFKDAEATCNLCHAGLVHGSLSGGIPLKKETCDDCHRRKKIYTEIELES